MRWFWIDSFVAFRPGERASAVKNISLAEEYIHDHVPGFPVFPQALMIEGMAQTAGILVGERNSFQTNVILAKIRHAEFSGYATPGDQVRYDAVIESLDEHGATTGGTVHRNGDPIGRVDLIFSHVGPSAKNFDLPTHNFVFGENFRGLLENLRKAQESEREQRDG